MANQNNDNLSESVLTLTPVELGDTLQVRQSLDETLTEALSESNVGLYEDLTLENFKIGTMVVACAFAMVAQFAPLPFPDSRLLLGLCCAAYFACSGALQFAVTFVEKDLVYTSQPFDNGGKDCVLKAHSSLGSSRTLRRASSKVRRRRGIGAGDKTWKWLALVSAQRFTLQSPHGILRSREKRSITGTNVQLIPNELYTTSVKRDQDGEPVLDGGGRPVVEVANKFYHPDHLVCDSGGDCLDGGHEVNVDLIDRVGVDKVGRPQFARWAFVAFSVSEGKREARARVVKIRKFFVKNYEPLTEVFKHVAAVGADAGGTATISFMEFSSFLKESKIVEGTNMNDEIQKIFIESHVHDSETQGTVTLQSEMHQHEFFIGMIAVSVYLKIRMKKGGRSSIARARGARGKTVTHVEAFAQVFSENLAPYIQRHLFGPAIKSALG
ncbi:hypothetical protein TrRE_jg1844, partial [Triparma retinervis]